MKAKDQANPGKQHEYQDQPPGTGIAKCAELHGTGPSPEHECCQIDREPAGGGLSSRTIDGTLQVRDLRTSVIKSASFTLPRGQCIAVRGPSGAGKTLLLRAIADLDPNQAAVSLDGRDRASIPAPEWRRLVGYVPAEPGWWGETVGDHFDNWPAASALLAKLGLAGEASGWPVRHASTGERLRLALVRALMMQPKVLLLDEPTAALDTGSIAAVEALIACRMRAGLAVLWVTHDPAQARRMARRLLVVEAGCVREETGW